MKTVNAAGLAEIRTILSKHHRRGDNFTDDMIRGWARDVEFQLSEGNSPCFEIREWDSIHGRTQEFTLSDAGIDTLCPECGSGEFSAQFTIYTGIETTYQSCDECAHHWGHE